MAFLLMTNNYSKVKSFRKLNTFLTSGSISEVPDLANKLMHSLNVSTIYGKTKKTESLKNLKI